MEKKQIKIILVILIIILLFGFIVWFILKSKKASKLTINSNLEGVIVYLNNQEYKAPIALELSPGNYTLWALKEGYREYNTQLELQPGEEKSINIELELDKDVPPEGAPTD